MYNRNVPPTYGNYHPQQHHHQMQQHHRQQPMAHPNGYADPSALHHQQMMHQMALQQQQQQQQQQHPHHGQMMSHGPPHHPMNPHHQMQIEMHQFQLAQQHVMNQLLQQEVINQQQQQQQTQQDKDPRHYRPITPQLHPGHHPAAAPPPTTPPSMRHVPNPPDPLHHMRLMEQQQQQQQQHQRQQHQQRMTPQPRPSVIAQTAPVPPPPRPSVLNQSLLENNPFMNWAKPMGARIEPTPAPSMSIPTPTATQPTLPQAQPPPPPIVAPPPPSSAEKAPPVEPIRVVAPSLQREREKKRIRDEQKRKRRSESDISKRQQSAIKTAPPKSIPPFELPQVTHHTSGLNGPIYKREELLKKSQEAELFNQAYRATMAQTNPHGFSVDEWIVSILRSNHETKPNGIRPEIIRLPHSDDQLTSATSTTPSTTAKNKSVAETYPILAQTISNIKEEIWLPKSLLQNESLTNPTNQIDTTKVPYQQQQQQQSSHHVNNSSSSNTTTITANNHSPLPGTAADVKIEPQPVAPKRPASPLPSSSASQRKRSKSNNDETVQRGQAEPESSQRKLSYDSQVKREATTTTTTSLVTVSEESKREISAADYDSDQESVSSQRNKKTSSSRRAPKKTKEETSDQKIMKTINRITSSGDLPPNVKKLSCKASAGESLLHAAARRGYIENLAYYIQMGMSVDSADNAGFTALHEAVTKGHYECVKLLLEQGSNPNVQSSDGTRPIHDVAENGDFQILRLLLAFGADPTLTTYSGETPLELAEESDTTKTVLAEYLEFINEANADDVITYPGEARDIDLYDEDSLGSIPSCGEDQDDDCEIEISDDPMPNSYWLVIGDRADNYVLLADVTSKYTHHGLQVHTLSRDEFSKQVNASAYASLPDDFNRNNNPDHQAQDEDNNDDDENNKDEEANIELVRLDTQFRNLFGSKVWNSSTHSCS